MRCGYPMMVYMIEPERYASACYMCPHSAWITCKTNASCTHTCFGCGDCVCNGEAAINYDSQKEANIRAAVRKLNFCVSMVFCSMRQFIALVIRIHVLSHITNTLWKLYMFLCMNVRASICSSRNVAFQWNTHAFILYQFPIDLRNSYLLCGLFLNSANEKNVANRIKCMLILCWYSRSSYAIPVNANLRDCKFTISFTLCTTSRWLRNR